MAVNSLFLKEKNRMPSNESDGRPLAYSYARMSTEAQLKGDSRRRQLELSKAYAIQHDLNLVESLLDVGKSGYTGANVSDGALGVFLKAIRAGKVVAGTYFIVESLDRISRLSPTEAFDIFRTITLAGIYIVDIQNGKIYSKDMDLAELLATLMYMNRAHEESKTKSLRLSAAWANKRNNANIKNLTKTCPSWLIPNKDGIGFSIDENKADIVRRIFRMSADGYGTLAIERALNKERVPGIGKTASWHKSYIQKILGNRAVLGEMQPHIMNGGKRQKHSSPIPGYFPRIIEDELFFRSFSGKAIRRIKGAGRKGNLVSNMFSGLLVCEYCNSSMKYEDKGPPPKGGRYIVCSRAHRGIGCERHYWRYQEFERAVLGYVAEIRLISLFDKDKSETERTELFNKLTGLDGKIAALTAMHGEAFSLLEPGNETRRLIVTEKMKSIEKEIERCKSEQNDINHQLVKLETDANFDPNELQKLVSDIQDDNEYNYHLRIKIQFHLKEVFKSIEVAAGGKRPFFTNLLEDLKVTYGQTKDRNVALKIERVEKALLGEGLDTPYFHGVFKDNSFRTIQVDNPFNPVPLSDAFGPAGENYEDIQVSVRFDF